MNIEVRKIDESELSGLAKMAKQTFYDTFVDTCAAEDMVHFLQENYSEATLLQELNKINYHYFFAKVNNEPVGYLLFAEDYTHWSQTKRYKALELKRIYILKEYQGKGVAQVLMDFYLNFATTNKYEVVWLGVWEHNEKAKAFYAKYGFVDSGYTHDFPIGNTPQTDVWLWKFL
jgi:diamine N-acetyltransferase